MIRAKTPRFLGIIGIYWTALAAGPANSDNWGPANENPLICAAIAVDSLKTYGISAGDVTDCCVDFVRYENFTEVTLEVYAWLTVKQCRTRRVVVEMTPECLPMQAHTRSGCKIDDIPAY